MRPLTLCLPFLGALFTLLTPLVVNAQRSPREAEMQVERLLQDARSYYDNLEISMMDDALEQILDIARRFGPATSKMAYGISDAYILKGFLVIINNAGFS